MKRFCCSIIALTLVLTFAANTQSDGKKRYAWIKVYNFSSYQLGVIVDPSTDEYDSLEHFMADGGRLINPGAHTQVEVKAGHHTLAGATAEGEGRSSVQTRVDPNQTAIYNVDFVNGYTSFSHRNGNGGGN